MAVQLPVHVAMWHEAPPGSSTPAGATMSAVKPPAMDAGHMLAWGTMLL